MISYDIMWNINHVVFITQRTLKDDWGDPNHQLLSLDPSDRTGGMPLRKRCMLGWSNTVPRQKAFPEAKCISEPGASKSINKKTSWKSHKTHVRGPFEPSNCPPVFFGFAHAWVQGRCYGIQHQWQKTRREHMHSSHGFGVGKALSIHQIFVEGNQASRC